MTEQWREFARSFRSAAQPSVTVELLGRTYKVPNRMRTVKADRDYAVMRALAMGRQCVFDVGANLGATALVMSAVMRNNGLLTAFEASELASRNILEVVRLNDLPARVDVVNAVMAEASGMVLDFYWDHASGGASTVAGYLDHRTPLRKATLALDDYVRQTGQRPELIKVDVEGAESQVLRGAAQTLGECRPVVFMELHSWDEMTVVQNATAILGDLAGMRYEMVYLKTKQAISDPAVLADRGRCHVLLVPTEWSERTLLESLDVAGL